MYMYMPHALYMNIHVHEYCTLHIVHVASSAASTHSLRSLSSSDLSLGFASSYPMESYPTQYIHVYMYTLMYVHVEVYTHVLVNETVRLTFHQTHAQFPWHEAAVSLHSHVVPVLDGLNVLGMCGVRTCESRGERERGWKLLMQILFSH